MDRHGPPALRARPRRQTNRLATHAQHSGHGSPRLAPSHQIPRLAPVTPNCQWKEARREIGAVAGGAFHLSLLHSANTFPSSTEGIAVNVAVQLEPVSVQETGAVEYRWDTDTDILIALLDGEKSTTGLSGSVELEGNDGSWLILDVAAGRIRGVEVAVWPDVHKSPSLKPPTVVEDARVIIPSRSSQPGIAALEIDTPLSAEADADERVIHFRLGKRREVRTVRLARDVLLDVDSQS